MVGNRHAYGHRALTFFFFSFQSVHFATGSNIYAVVNVIISLWYGEFPNCEIVCVFTRLRGLATHLAQHLA